MSRQILLLFIFFILATTFGAIVKEAKANPGNKWNTLDGTPTLLIGHRGEKVFMPEHTVASYELASAEGAEFVEPDLTLTSDGELVCYHDLILKSGTDVADHPEFAGRMRNFSGWLENSLVNYTNEWFIQNFTVQELRTLNVKQKEMGIRLQYFNQLFHVPTFKEYLQIVHKMAHKLNKPIGVIPELKHPLFNNAPWSPHYMEEKLLDTLREFGYPVNKGDEAACKYENISVLCGNVIIQSFKEDSIRYLQGQTNRELMMLVDDDVKLLTYEGLKNISGFAHYFGVWKEYLNVGPEAVLAQKGIEVDMEQVTKWGGFVPANKFVEYAHKLDLKMSIYTIYDSREPSGRGCAKECEPENKTKELYSYFEMGVDGIFVENIMEARELRLEFGNIKEVNSEGLSVRLSGNQYRVFLIALIVYIFMKCDY